MYSNLKAEQARHGMTNAAVAKKLGISRTCYESKLRTGNFRVSEAMTLCELYNCDFNYLFAHAGPAQGSTQERRCGNAQSQTFDPKGARGPSR